MAKKDLAWGIIPKKDLALEMLRLWVQMYPFENGGLKYSENMIKDASDEQLSTMLTLQLEEAGDAGARLAARGLLLWVIKEYKRRHARNQPIRDRCPGLGAVSYN